MKNPSKRITWKEISRQKFLMVCAAIFFVYGIVFYYVPLAGWVMAFQDYKPKDGLFGSKFVGLAKFKFLFSDDVFLRDIRNLPAELLLKNGHRRIAIYVQERNEDTDAQCEAAKAAWDALTDTQKELVEGENADPDYFGQKSILCVTI